MREPHRYVRRVSGPLLDRIDLRVVMPRMEADQLVEVASPEASVTVAARIAAAWSLAHERNGGVPNAQLHGARISEACALDATARRTVKEVATGLDLTGRGIHRMLRVARTVADLAGAERVTRDHVLAAASMRDRSMELELAA